MLFRAVALLACCAVPSTVLAAKVPRVATPGLKLVNLDVKLADFYTEHLAQKLTEAGAQVTTPRQIASMLGIERQKQLLGCAPEATECLSEFANALGVDALLTGDIARIGANIQLNVRLVGATSGKPLGSASQRVGDEEHLVDALSDVARTLAADLVTALGPEYALAPSTSAGPSVRALSWVPAVVFRVTGGQLEAIKTSLGVTVLADAGVSTPVFLRLREEAGRLHWETSTGCGYTTFFSAPNPLGTTQLTVSLTLMRTSGLPLGAATTASFDNFDVNAP